MISISTHFLIRLLSSAPLFAPPGFSSLCLSVFVPIAVRAVPAFGWASLARIWGSGSAGRPADLQLALGRLVGQRRLSMNCLGMPMDCFGTTAVPYGSGVRFSIVTGIVDYSGIFLYTLTLAFLEWS